MALTKVTYSMIEGSQANILDFGADPTGASDCSAAIKNALESGAQYIYVPPGTYALTASISATIPTNVTFYGNGTFVYTGATNNTFFMLAVETGNNTFTIDGLSFDGDNKIAAGLRVYNSAAPSANTLPNLTVSNNSFIRFRMNVIGIWNDAVFIAGSYQLVTIANNRVRLITRAAGTGTPGSTGTAGISIGTLSTSQYTRECLHYGNQYAAILSDEASGSAANVDHDAFRFFAPAPSPVGSGSPPQYSQGTVTSYGNIYRNCRGRGLKIQAIGTVRDETFIRDSDYCNTGGSVEINFQYGVGMVSNCQFLYSDYGSPTVSPLVGGVNLVSFYQGTDYNTDGGACIVNGLQVFNSITTALPSSGIGPIVSATEGTGTIERKLVSISNVSVSANSVYAIATLGYGASVYGTMRLDNIVVPSIATAAILTNGADNNFDVIATNVINIDGVSTPANAKPFVLSSLLAPVSYGGQLLGGLNQGFLQPYNNGTANKAPSLSGAFLNGFGTGGGVSVQATSVADDASFTFDPRFYNTGRGLFAVSIDFDSTTQGLFATGGNAIYTIAATASPANLFSVSTAGTNPDVDGKFNMWYLNGSLNVKNRLGQSCAVTVTFFG
jgi:hypothetical protein